MYGHDDVLLLVKTVTEPPPDTMARWTMEAIAVRMSEHGVPISASQVWRICQALDLKPGDEVIFTVDGTRSVYRVTGHLIVRPADSWIADQTHEYTGTLYACHPVGSMAERYVVRMVLET